jgi:hypothetical protein
MRVCWVPICMMFMLAALLGGCDAPDLASTISPSPAAPGPTGQQPEWGKPTKTAGCVVNGALPDPACTPGDIFAQATKAAICTPGYSRSVRDVPVAVKDAVYAAYGIASHIPGQYEVDHLVSLELGGSNDISNLWPEAAAPKPGFHEKDEVENTLHDQVCAGQIDLPTAQREIATNWLAVYDQLHGLSSNAPAPANPVQSQVPHVSSPAPASGQGGVAPSGDTCPADYPVKGNIRSDGSRIYHLPNDPSYARTRPEQCFASAADAASAGFRPPR